MWPVETKQEAEQLRGARSETVWTRSDRTVALCCERSARPSVGVVMGTSEVKHTRAGTNAEESRNRDRRGDCLLMASIDFLSREISRGGVMQCGRVYKLGIVSVQRPIEDAREDQGRVASLWCRLEGYGCGRGQEVLAVARASYRRFGRHECRCRRQRSRATSSTTSGACRQSLRTTARQLEFVARTLLTSLCCVPGQLRPRAGFLPAAHEVEHGVTRHITAVHT